MKTKVFLLCCFFCFALAGELFSQPWQVLNSGTTSNVLEVKFVNPTTGFVTCSDGKIRKTIDGGNIWNTVLNQTIGINSLFFVNESTGFGVADFGRVFKTTDGGNTWSVTTPTSYHLYSVYFSDNLTGYAVGHHSCILKTTNAGVTWANQISPVSDVMLTGVYFNNNRGYISVLSGVTNLLFTENGGSLWQDGKIRSGVVLGFSVSFNGDKGVVAGYEEMGSTYHPLIFKTNSNGNSWTEYRLSSRAQLFDITISPSDPNKMCAVGRYINDPVYQNQGLIMRTSDGGENWTEEQWSVSNQFLWGVCATSNDFFVAGPSGLILKTSHTVGISNSNLEIPAGYTLSQNYPNPFNPKTKINFSISTPGNVKLAVYNTAGVEVSVLLNQSLSVGSYTYDFDATHLTSGVYFYTLQAENFQETKRMVLLK